MPIRSKLSFAVLAVQIAMVAAQSAITVNPGTTYQTMDGFGCSEAFGEAWGIYNLNAAGQTQALNLLFDKTAGAGLSILRNRIGSGATNGDSIEPTSPGSPTAPATYTWDGQDSAQVWVSQQAKALGVTYIYADAWSAPGYMKTNGDDSNGGYLCGVTGETCTSGDWRQAYANLIVKYIQDYASEGVKIDFVGFLNEPEFAATYSGMLSDGTQAASFIPILYEGLKNASLTTGITCCDAEGWNDQVTYTAQLTTAGAIPYLSRITSHSYTSSPSSPIDTSLRVWETEYCDLNDPTFISTWYASGGAAEGFTWAMQIYNGITTANLSAYFHWYGASTNGDNGGLVSISGSGTIAPSGRLWAFAMFSRYVQPNAVRIATSGAPTGVHTVAFQNPDGTIAVVALNAASTTQAVTVGIAGAIPTSVTALHMDNTVNLPTVLSASLSGGKVSATLPGWSVVTFILNGASSGSPAPVSSSSVAAPPPTTLTTKTSTIASATTTKSVVPTTSSKPAMTTAIPKSIITTTKPSPTSAPAITTTAAAASGAARYAQCGGTGWAGATTCVAPYKCSPLNAYYSQCL